MSGLVLELQRDSLNKDISVSDLLRKALIVSKKLAVPEIEEWINKELSGYPIEDDNIPLYRSVTGLIKVFNPYHGWQPLQFGNADLGDSLSTRIISQAIGELVLINNNNNDEGSLQIPFSQDIKNKLMKLMSVPLEPTLLISDTQIYGILEAVRNEVLNWALALESKGILGVGMSFSIEEKATASQVTYQITNNIGSMENSQLQQDSKGAYQSQNIVQNNANISEFIQELKNKLSELNLEKDIHKELSSDILTIESQLSSPKPKNIIVSESLKSVRNILEGITGSMLATGLLAQLANLI